MTLVAENSTEISKDLNLADGTVAHGRHASVAESVVHGAIANLTAQPFTWAASLLLGIVMPRFLGSDALGEFAIAVTITGLTSTVLALGIPDYLTRRIARRVDSMEGDVVIAAIVQVTSAIVGAIGIGIVAHIIAPSFVELRLLDIALVGMVVGSAQPVLLSALRGREHHRRYAWLNAAAVVTSALGCTAVLFFTRDVIAFAIAGPVLAVASGVLNWKLSGIRLRWPSATALWSRAHEFIRGGFPFLSWNVTLAIYGGIDQVLLGAAVRASEVGWYAAAYRVVAVTVFIPTVVTTPLFPALSRSVNEPHTLRSAIGHTLRISLLLTVPIAAGIVAVAPLIPGILGWPADFSGAVPLIALLSLHLPIVAIDMVLGTVIMAINREARWVRIGLLAAVFNITGNVIGIPIAERLLGNGAIAASALTVLTEVFMFFGALTIIPRQLLDLRLAWQGAAIFVAGAAGCLVAMTLVRTAFPLAFIAGACTYFGLCLILRVLKIDDVRSARNILVARQRSANPLTS